MADPVSNAPQTGMADVEAEKIRLVEAELAQTNEFVKGVLTTGAALRGSAITIWLALLGFAAQQTMPTLAMLAALVAVTFYFADGYHGWLYGQAFAHARKIERLLSNYYDTLSRRQNSSRAQATFAGKLRAHRYGLYNSFRDNFSPGQIWKSARPRLFYRYLYPTLTAVALAVGTAGFLGFNFKVGAPSPTRVIIEQAPGSASNAPPALTAAPSRPASATSDASPTQTSTPATLPPLTPGAPP